ncbi:MAG: OB-fold nucleic acid binding domain-containing protein [Candidatus Hadarchaeales archaeon]
MGNGKIVRLSLISSLAGLAAVYATALSISQRITPIAKIDNSFIGARVIISGQIIDVQSSGNKHMFLKIKDDSGGIITVPIFSNLASKLTLTIGLLDYVEIRGNVSVYQNELEVIPSKPEDIKIVHTAPASISEIKEENLGKPVKVYGIVSSREIIGAGNIILNIGENGRKLKVFIPSKIVEGIPEVHVGDEVVIGGWLQLYNNEIELKVTSHLCIQKLETFLK